MNSLIFDIKTARKILACKLKLENKLGAKLEIRGRKVEISGEELEVYTAEKVLSAIERNFSLSDALLLADENYILRDIPIKEFTKKKNLSLVRARIIGTQGKTLKLISELSECRVVLNNNIVSIIGRAEKIKDVINAVKSLISGSKQGNIYSYLERQRARHKFTDENLGLKIKK